MWELLVGPERRGDGQLLTTIGEQFDVGNEICGVSVNMKRNNCIFMVWNKTATFEQAINKIEQESPLQVSTQNEAEDNLEGSVYPAVPLQVESFSS